MADRCYISILLAFLWITNTLAAVTWPSSYDELEDIMFLNQGYNARQLSLPVTPCQFQGIPGQIPAAGFVRTAFHDVAPHNSNTGEGGMDASIAWELTGKAGQFNGGPAFNTTLTFLSRYYSAQASMSDLLALSLYTAVRGCGGPIVPIRTGRVDATGPGNLGVPVVNDTQSGFRDLFGRMGFSAQDMIKMVACGHSLGGVHTQLFPKIVPPSIPNAFIGFDTTPAAFDNNVAVEFVQNKTIDPLVVGPELTRADRKVYEADGGFTINQLADPQTYQSTCQDILQRMIDTVPSQVKLTAPIEVYDIKPGKIALTLATDGSSFLFEGEIRIRTTINRQDSIENLVLEYVDRKGAYAGSINTTAVGTAAGYDESFTFYKFSSSISADTSISSFNVTITRKDGSGVTYDNNGDGYKVQDIINLHRPACTISSTADSDGKYTATVVAAVHNGAKDVSLSVALQTPRDIPFPLLTKSSVDLSKGNSIGEYTLYSGTFLVSVAQVNSTSFDLSCSKEGSKYAYAFQRLNGFGLQSNKTVSKSINGSPGTDLSNTPGANTTSNKTDSFFDKYQGGWTIWAPKPTSTAHHNAPVAACGADAGCAAQPWALNPEWAVPIPSDPFAYKCPTMTNSSSYQNGNLSSGSLTGNGSNVTAYQGAAARSQYVPQGAMLLALLSTISLGLRVA